MPSDRSLQRAIVATYASALLDEARNADAVFAIDGELSAVCDIVSGNARFTAALKDESIDVDARKNLVSTVFSDATPAVRSLLGLMVERQEVGLLKQVRAEYTRIAEQELDAVFVTVTTAVELDDHLREVINDKLVGDFGTKVLVRETVDPQILGGIVMNARGKRIDASVRYQLERARVALASGRSGSEG